MVEVYTSYFSNYKNIPSEYQCVSIANSRPSNICVPVWSDVIPHWSLVKAFKNKTITSNEFMFRYIEMLKSKPIENYKKFLLQFNCPVVLLCWEKDNSWCHRSLLNAFLKAQLDETEFEFKGEYMNKIVEYKPEGVCCKKIILEYRENTKTVENVTFEGGCKGWSTACAKLIRQMPFDYVVSYLEGITCGKRQTSCPDQLAKFVKTLIL